MIAGSSLDSAFGTIEDEIKFRVDLAKLFSLEEHGRDIFAGIESGEIEVVIMMQCYPDRNRGGEFRYRLEFGGRSEARNARWGRDVSGPVVVTETQKTPRSRAALQLGHNRRTEFDEVKLEGYEPEAQLAFFLRHHELTHPSLLKKLRIFIPPSYLPEQMRTVVTPNGFLELDIFLETGDHKSLKGLVMSELEVTGIKVNPKNISGIMPWLTPLYGRDAELSGNSDIAHSKNTQEVEKILTTKDNAPLVEKLLTLGPIPYLLHDFEKFTKNPRDYSKVD